MISPTYALSLVTAPATKPVTVDELAKEMRITHSFENSRMVRALDTAIAQVQQYAGIQIMRATYRMVVGGFPVCVPRSMRDIPWIDSDLSIRLPRPPFSSVSSITYYDSDNSQQTLATTVYSSDTRGRVGHVFLAYDQSWPQTVDRRDAVAITFLCGYADADAVPSNIKTAVLRAAHMLFEQSDGDVYSLVEQMLDAERLVAV